MKPKAKAINLSRVSPDDLIREIIRRDPESLPAEFWDWVDGRIQRQRADPEPAQPYPFIRCGDGR